MIAVLYGTFNPANDSFSMIHQFFANVSTGGVPGAGVIVASNNIIYGTTTQGGATYDSISGVAGGGVIYSIDPATNTYTDVYDFPDSNGYGPTSELFQAADGKLYGMVSTSYTDSFSSGYLFSFNPANNQFALLANLFPSSPLGYRTPPLVQGPDLKLYGVIQNVLFADSPSEAPGVLFSYDINNSNLTIVHTFSIADGTPWEAYWWPTAIFMAKRRITLWATTEKCTAIILQTLLLTYLPISIRQPVLAP